MTGGHMKIYQPETFTYGYELELGDIDRRRLLPVEFGKWEYAECDIVNIHGEYAGQACDPLGELPPMGGEINIFPAYNPEELTNRIVDCIEWFKGHGDRPSSSCVNHGHVHIHVPGLRDDIAALKRLTSAIDQYQHEIIRLCYGYEEHPDMAEAKTARTYLKWDGGRPMPNWMASNIIDKAEDFDDFIRIQCCGRDGVSRGRPFRYAVNTYCLKHTDTIEFRCFRASLSEYEIWSSIDFARRFLLLALNGGNTTIRHLITSNGYLFPRFEYNHEHYLAWERTKWPKERGKKRREYIEI